MLSLVQSGPVGRCYLSTASPCWPHVTSRDPQALTLMCTFRARARLGSRKEMNGACVYWAVRFQIVGKGVFQKKENAF